MIKGSQADRARQRAWEEDRRERLLTALSGILPSEAYREEPRPKPRPVDTAKEESSP